jgi:DNA invertase Pin-like site-specific DNA recombinase
MTRLYFQLAKRRGIYRPELILMTTDQLCEHILGCSRVGRPKGNVFNVAKALELYKQGLCDAEVAKGIGVHRQTIYKWRRKNKLPANNQMTRRLA